VNIVKMHFVRHGKTDDNHKLGDLIFGLEGVLFSSIGTVLSGHNEVNLTIPGLVQAFQSGASARAQGLDFEALIWLISPQKRARQTFCAFVAGADFLPHATRVFYEEGIRERSAGDLESMTRDGSSSVWPEMAKGKEASVFTDAEACYPGGESLRMVYDRANRCLSRYLDGPDLIVFSHELTIKAAMSLLMSNTLTNDAFKHVIPNASLISLSGNAFGDFTKI
jgi:broad specificity phosphatase PhoE